MFGMEQVQVHVAKLHDAYAMLLQTAGADPLPSQRG
jgi:hypothetical protein